MRKKKKNSIPIILGIAVVAILGYFNVDENQLESISNNNSISNNVNSSVSTSYVTTNIPEYSGEIYVTINNNISEFTEEDFDIEEDYYSELENGRVRNGYDKD